MVPVDTIEGDGAKEGKNGKPTERPPAQDEEAAQDAIGSVTTNTDPSGSLSRTSTDPP